MATTVKIVRDMGHDGRLMHKHGEGDWHPAHRKHLGDGTGRAYALDAHEANDAAHPTNAATVLTTPALVKAYAACLEGVEQPEFLVLWEARKVAMKAKRAAKAPAEEELPDEAELGNKVQIGI